ncbi:hypothetical protein B0H10DRAFT_1627515, partial [Mycena sp. CBHHK59/15]
EMDQKIQRTIHTQFKDCTLICIARTFSNCAVLDAGNIAEFDTPLNLFNQEGGAFRGLCKRSSITLSNI